MREIYTVRPLKAGNHINVTVPGSKSITNRALLLAAMGKGRCVINGALFSDDSRAFVSCLENLGFDITADEAGRKITVNGTGGNIPKASAAVNVRSAGTAARFLTVFLAFAGGRFDLDASEQMCRRPMEPLISVLRSCGITIVCKDREGHFPLHIDSEGTDISEISINTDISSQFASAVLMAAPLLKEGLNVRLEGGRKSGSYINITLTMLKQFGYGFRRDSDCIRIEGGTRVNPEFYDVEPDISAACYFYAISPLCNRTVQVSGVHLSSMQGDIRFIKTMEELGCVITEDGEGIILTPPPGGSYRGLDLSMKDYSDQTMTMAVVAAFADSPTTIRDVGHIRLQESDRLIATVNELNRVGCSCHTIDDNTGIYIEPGVMHGADIITYEDHRMAMAFSLIGLRVPGINILDPMCCRKTFEDYFDVLDSLTVS